MSGAEFWIDLCEGFPHLPNAPIVEAVIHWRARSEKKLEPESLLELLKGKLPDYPTSQRQQELGVEAEFRTEGSSVRQHHTWQGFRFETADKLNVAQFTRNGFVFSRLKPYEDWQRFEAEAQRLWQVYRDLADPSEVLRLGVRFINLITLTSYEELKRVLAMPPLPPQDMQLPLDRFMHQSAFEVPGHPYRLNVIQTIQPPSPPNSESLGLILDLDVFTTRPIQFEEVGNRLRQMQWLKNKAFFSLLTKAAIVPFLE